MPPLARKPAPFKRSPRGRRLVHSHRLRPTPKTCTFGSWAPPRSPKTCTFPRQPTDSRPKNRTFPDPRPISLPFPPDPTAPREHPARARPEPHFATALARDPKNHTFRIFHPDDPRPKTLPFQTDPIKSRSARSRTANRAPGCRCRHPHGPILDPVPLETCTPENSHLSTSSPRLSPRSPPPKPDPRPSAEPGSFHFDPTGTIRPKTHPLSRPTVTPAPRSCPPRCAARPVPRTLTRLPPAHRRHLARATTTATAARKLSPFPARRRQTARTLSPPLPKTHPFFSVTC